MNLQDRPTLAGMEMSLSDRGRLAVGAMGELTARLILEKNGYEVSKAGRRCGDLRAIDPETGEISLAEVKTARQGKDKKWRFLLWKKGQQNHKHADVILLLAVLRSGQVVPFVVPVSVLADQKQCCISSHPQNYSGKLACYRQKVKGLRL